MHVRPLIITSAGVVLLLGLIALVGLQRLPAGTQLPIHWNAAGEVDRFASAPFALFTPVVMAAVLSALFAVLPRLEPLQERMAGSAALLETAWIGLLSLMALVELITVAPAFGLAVPATLMLAAPGLLLIAIGNALPKSRPGFFVGIRTPWTITDPDNWVATHRLGARTMMAGGALMLIGALLPIGATGRLALILAAIALAVIPPLIYSWWHWERKRRGG